MAKTMKIAGAAGALLAGTVAAHAGGFERSGNPIGALFEGGTYAEFSLGYLAPDVSGVIGAPTGDVAGNYLSFGAAYKRDLTDDLSMAIIIDQPYGADTDYSTLPIMANLRSQAVTALLRYKMNERFSVHGGLRYVNLDGSLQVGGPTLVYSADGDLGFVLGGAYEIPDIALRVALTYFSGTDHVLPSQLPIPAGTINPPQSVNLDFQTGIAANTLLFGQIRWADWTDTQVIASAGNPPVVTYSNDVLTYTLGVGRKLNETWSIAASIGHEKAEGGLSSRLSPTDGYTSLGLGATYTADNMKITGGVRYYKLGDASTAGPGTFTDNSAIGFGIKVGYTF